MEKGKRNKGIIKLVIIYIIMDMIILLILTHFGFKGRGPLSIDEVALVIPIILIMNFIQVFFH